MTIEAPPTLPAALLSTARLLPNRDAILPLLPKGRVIVEVGVGLGDFSRKLLDICQPAQFVAIDSFRLHELPSFWGRPTREIFGAESHEAAYRARFADWIDDGRMQVLADDSAAALRRLDDSAADIFYVDADHSFDSVQRELSVISSKVKDDGWIVMNDYTLADVAGGMGAYGVIHATNAFMLAEAWEMTHFALQDFMYCDVVLRKLPPERAAAFRATLGPDPATVRIGQLEQENLRLKAQIEALHGSTSWRASSPLRALGRWLGRA